MKAIKTTTYELDMSENLSLVQTDILLDEIIAEFEENDATLIESPITGEVITLDELQRMKGIIDGLLNIAVWSYQ